MTSFNQVKNKRSLKEHLIKHPGMNMLMQLLMLYSNHMNLQLKLTSYCPVHPFPQLHCWWTP